MGIIMGYVKVRAKIWNIDDPSKEAIVTLLADTGAIYTVLPSNLLREIGVKTIGKRSFRLADNRVKVYDLGLIGIEINGLKTHTPVIFGEENVYLLGVVTLEELGLQVDPLTGELKPLELLLM